MMDLSSATPLALMAAALGGFLVLSSVPGIAAPAWARRMITAFPRSGWPGWLLAAFDLTWVSWVILHAALGRFEWMKPGVYAAGPLAFVLIVFFMDELLSPRALGGLLLLIANPVLRAARWHPSDAHYVMTVIAYAWVFFGMLFVLSPYRFRQLAAPLIRTDARVRALSAVRLLAGAAILYLGLRVY